MQNRMIASVIQTGPYIIYDLLCTKYSRVLDKTDSDSEKIKKEFLGTVWYCNDPEHLGEIWFRANKYGGGDTPGVDLSINPDDGVSRLYLTIREGKLSIKVGSEGLALNSDLESKTGEINTKIKEINNSLKDLVTSVSTWGGKIDLSSLSYKDEPIDGFFVKSVSETDGIISVSRGGITVSDIPSLPFSSVPGLSDSLSKKMTGLEVSGDNYISLEKTGENVNPTISATTNTVQMVTNLSNSTRDGLVKTSDIVNNLVEDEEIIFDYLDNLNNNKVNLPSNYTYTESEFDFNRVLENNSVYKFTLTGNKTFKLPEDTSLGIMIMLNIKLNSSDSNYFSIALNGTNLLWLTDKPLDIEGSKTEYKNYLITVLNGLCMFKELKS